MKKITGKILETIESNSKPLIDFTNQNFANITFVPPLKIKDGDVLEILFASELKKIRTGRKLTIILHI